MEPPEDSAPGDRVTVQGFEEHPDEQLNPKKKIFEQVSGGAKATAAMLHVCLGSDYICAATGHLICCVL